MGSEAETSGRSTPHASGWHSLARLRVQEESGSGYRPHAAYRLPEAPAIYLEGDVVENQRPSAPPPGPWAIRTPAAYPE